MCDSVHDLFGGTAALCCVPLCKSGCARIRGPSVCCAPLAGPTMPGTWPPVHAATSIRSWNVLLLVVWVCNRRGAGPFRATCLNLLSALQAVKDAAGAVRQPGPLPRVALIEWIDPIMGSGHWCALIAPHVCLIGNPGPRQRPQKHAAIVCLAVNCRIIWCTEPRACVVAMAVRWPRYLGFRFFSSRRTLSLAAPTPEAADFRQFLTVMFKPRH